MIYPEYISVRNIYLQAIMELTTFNRSNTLIHLPFPCMYGSCQYIPPGSLRPCPIYLVGTFRVSKEFDV